MAQPSTTGRTFPALPKSFRITAFIDVLGWGSLTQGIPLLTFRRMQRPDSLTPRAVRQAERLVDSVQIAQRINSDIRQILVELRGLCVPSAGC